MDARPMHTIAIFPKIQPDTVAAIFLLREHGGKAFPGIENAEIAFWTALPAGKTAEACEAEGILPIDLGGGTFDHHVEEGRARQDSAATLVAKYLGVDKDPALQKLLAYVKRDDLEGKGTVSEDPLDRSFGLSGLMTTYGRVFHHRPDELVRLVLPLFEAHVAEQRQRLEENPREWKELKESGKGRVVSVRGRQAVWKVAVVESDNIALPGFLRAYFHIDLVIQRLGSGHVNIITNQKKKIDLRPIIARIRAVESKKRGIALAPDELVAQGRVDKLPLWFYDVMATTLQNGGIKPQHIEPTMLSLDEIVEAVRAGLVMA